MTTIMITDRGDLEKNTLSVMCLQIFLEKQLVLCLGKSVPNISCSGICAVNISKFNHESIFFSIWF